MRFVLILVLGTLLHHPALWAQWPGLDGPRIICAKVYSMGTIHVLLRRKSFSETAPIVSGSLSTHGFKWGEGRAELTCQMLDDNMLGGDGVAQCMGHLSSPSSREPVQLNLVKVDKGEGTQLYAMLFSHRLYFLPCKPRFRTGRFSMTP